MSHITCVCFSCEIKPDIFVIFSVHGRLEFLGKTAGTARIYSALVDSLSLVAQKHCVFCKACTIRLERKSAENHESLHVFSLLQQWPRLMPQGEYYKFHLFLLCYSVLRFISHPLQPSSTSLISYPSHPPCLLFFLTSFHQSPHF